MEDVELQPLLEAAWCTLDNDAAAQQIDFKMDCGECVIQGDTSLLYAAFRNLLENAVKYNHPGGNICISVSCHKGSAHLVFQNSGMTIFLNLSIAQRNLTITESPAPAWDLLSHKLFLGGMAEILK